MVEGAPTDCWGHARPRPLDAGVHPEGPAVTRATALVPSVPALRESASTFYLDSENSLPLSQVEICQKTAFDWFSKPPRGVNFSARKKARPGSIQASSPHADGCFWVMHPTRCDPSLAKGATSQLSLALCAAGAEMDAVCLGPWTGHHQGPRWPVLLPAHRHGIEEPFSRWNSGAACSSSPVILAEVAAVSIPCGVRSGCHLCI